MWVYYEDKGKHIGMTASRHTALRNFIHNAEIEDEVLSFMESVKLPTLERMELKVMFDIPSFMHKFNLDCLNCGETHVYGSCCDGAPRFPSNIESMRLLFLNGTFIDYVKDDFKPILKRCRDEQTLEYIYDEEKQRLISYINSDGVEECPLRLEDRCGVHKYLLDNNIPYYYKPCTWMYPFDCVLNLDARLKPIAIFVFMLCERTSMVSRWGSQSCYRHCIDDNLNEKIEASGYDEYCLQTKCDKSKYFKTDEYTEAYKLYQSEILYLLGSKCLRKFNDYFGGEKL